MLRVAVPDYMTQQACVSCHNSHKERTWEKDYWKVGDKRGLLEIITPLDENLKANIEMRDEILLIIALSMSVLILFYSVSLIRREKQLLGINDSLDKKVKEEVKKNIENEKALIIQNRSASMGDMMSAIIHQWKQPLNIISLANSSLSMLNDFDTLDKKTINETTSKIQKQIVNMNLTVTDFSNFFKPQKESLYDINETINNVNKLVSSIYKEQAINIQLDLHDNIITNGYPNELAQVLINIYNNARDQILEINPENRSIYVNSYKTESKALITITDCAGGINEAVINQIFNPYFTTKEETHGTGIGLEMSKTIIQKVEGKLFVENKSTSINNKKYQGAMFTIELVLSK